MSMSVWFREDIANALLATYHATCETNNATGGEDTARTAAYFAGYRTAISTLALMFGISPSLVIPEIPECPRIGS